MDAELLPGVGCVTSEPEMSERTVPAVAGFGAVEAGAAVCGAGGVAPEGADIELASFNVAACLFKTAVEIIAF